MMELINRINELASEHGYRVVSFQTDGLSSVWESVMRLELVKNEIESEDEDG